MVDPIGLLRRQAAILEALSERFRKGLLTLGIAESMLLADEADTIRGEILDAVVELERRDGR